MAAVLGAFPGFGGGGGLGLLGAPGGQALGAAGLPGAAPVVAAATPAKTDSGEPPAKRSRTANVVVPNGISCLQHIDDWYEGNKKSFSPPVCNKLMHKGQLSIMFVGGPNTRKDFHLEEGSEFFYQMRGDMELPTVQKGKRKLVKIRQGQVFALPSRIPHSPQRPNEGSLGLVVERARTSGEQDGLVFFTDFDKCDKVEWERFFTCADLGTDLPPVIKAYREWKESPESSNPNEWPEERRPVRQDRETEVPEPFYLEDFLKANEDKLEAGEALPLFGVDHPDKEFKIFVTGGPSEQRPDKWHGDTWIYQIKGSARISCSGGTLTLDEGCCCIINPNTGYEVYRATGSIGMTVRQDPKGNASGKRGGEAAAEQQGAAPQQPPSVPPGFSGFGGFGGGGLFGGGGSAFGLPNAPALGAATATLSSFGGPAQGEAQAPAQSEEEDEDEEKSDENEDEDEDDEDDD